MGGAVRTRNTLDRHHSTDLTRFLAQVIFATDEWFATADFMLKRESAEFIPDKYTTFGKWMDGWETRRKRTPGHDWCIIKLAYSGFIDGFQVDTTHFTGNYAPAISIQASDVCPTHDGGRSEDPECITPSIMGEMATEDELKAAELLGSEKWAELVPYSRLRPGYPNSCTHYFDSKVVDKKYTYIRVNIFPDGGVARLRVFGRINDPSKLSPDDLVDLVALENGASALACSDKHFGTPSNIISPGRGINMGDGWETARKINRGPILVADEQGLIQYSENDWCTFKLATVGRLDNIIVDTNFFKGNFPESCEISGCLSTSDPDHDSSLWQVILPRTKLSANCEHPFDVSQLRYVGPMSHVKLTIFPDGGVMRLRLFGYPFPQRNGDFV
jgi:allantoicase